jgi:hypothetical protein
MGQAQYHGCLFQLLTIMECLFNINIMVVYTSY